MQKKITEAQVLNTVKEVIGSVELTGEVTVEDVIAYCDKKIAQGIAKAEKAKEKRAEKAAANDELIAKVEAALTGEFQTGQEITDAVDFPEITKAKVVNRLTKLIAAGKAVKGEIKVEGVKGKTVAYKLA